MHPGRAGALQSLHPPGGGHQVQEGPEDRRTPHIQGECVCVCVFECDGEVGGLTFRFIFRKTPEKKTSSFELIRFELILVDKSRRVGSDSQIRPKPQFEEK